MTEIGAKFSSIPAICGKRHSDRRMHRQLPLLTSNSAILDICSAGDARVSIIALGGDCPRLINSFNGPN